MTPQQHEALQRQVFYAFIASAFRELHPGTRFIPNWHVDAMCQALQDVFECRTRRLLITIPPRHLKSICTTVGLCAWALGRDPGLRIMTASYGDRLARDHSDQFRTLIESDWFRALFPHTRINARANRSNEVKTTMGGGRLMVSRGGAATGFGADILIVDDLLKADEARSETERENAIAFFEGTLLSRLNDPSTGRIVVIQQRLHENDLAGHLIARGGYRHLNLPAIAEAPETFDLAFGRTHRRNIGDVLFEASFPAEVLGDMRRELGEHTFQAQYQQNPVPPGGAIIHADWFNERYDFRPDRNAFSRVIQSWDIGTSDQPGSDYTVGLTFGYYQRKWLLLDVFRRRMELPDVKRSILRMQRDWNADYVVVEKAGSSIGLFQDLRNIQGMRSVFRAVTPTASKEERLLGQTPKLEEGLIQLPQEAPWLQDFLHELQGFPHARHDDQVDALSQFLQHISSRGTSRIHPDEPGRRRSSRRAA